MVRVTLLVLLLPSLIHAADWPTYMADPARSGTSAETLALPLFPRWTQRSAEEPKPAWPLPQVGWTELPRVEFDNAFYPVADASSVYYGSSTDQHVYAMDAATGSIRWKFATGGPVRLAPTLHQGKLFVGSDDGFVYCLRCEDGSLVWSHNAAPNPRRVLGNGRVTSLWPVRTNVHVEEGRAYFGAGVFPYHKVFMIAVEADTGKLVWKNDHLTVYGGFSPQGYLLASEHGLIVPSGRSTPLCLDRKTGEMLFSVTPSKNRGESNGVYGVIVDDKFWGGSQNTLVGVRTKDGTLAGRWPLADRLVATPDSVYLLKGPPAPAYGRKSPSGQTNDVVCNDRELMQKFPMKDIDGLKKIKRWRFPRPDVESMILAGPHLIVGGKDEVILLDRMKGTVLETHKVDGLAVGLAVSHGRLIVSTTKGALHIFSPDRTSPIPPVARQTPPDATRNKIAKDLLAKAGIAKGFAVVMGPDAAPLGCELAREAKDLRVSCFETTPETLTASRKLVDDAGLYGRVVVELAKENELPYPDFAANLVVHLHPGVPSVEMSKELMRVLKPSGGVMFTDAGQKQFTRGNLKGSGWWTHQFADAGNTGSSGDQRVKGRLDVLWFGEPGPDEFPDRHLRGEAPLIMNGRVFCEGWNFLEKKHSIFCFDAYNGVRYWKREVEGAVRLQMPTVSGNLVCDETSVFIAAGPKCFRLDAMTGDILAVYETPKEEDHRPWAYLSVKDGMLVGSAEKKGRNRFSDQVFAIDLKTNRLAWSLSFREIRDTTFAIAHGKLFFADNRKDAPPKGLKLIDPTFEEKMIRSVVALDLKTGQTLWDKEIDLACCGRWEQGVWGTIQALAKDDVLIFAGAYTIYNGGKGSWDHPHKAVAVSTKDGATLWSQDVANRSRPILMHEALLAEPLFYDVQKGTKILKKQGNKMVPWTMGPRTGGCGSLSASDCMVFGRGGYTTWRDIDSGPGGTFVGMRPGCFINIIPAGGVVVQAEASSGCTCSQAIQCTIVFRPRDLD